MDRIILHCDLNSFYASVELRSRPDLQNVPVAVCGDPTSRHGIILAKNEPAKKFGVQTAETIWQAKKKCPELVLLPPHHKLYRQVSKEVNTIYESTRTWWSPSASMRAGWTSPIPSTSSAVMPRPWQTICGNG